MKASLVGSESDYLRRIDEYVASIRSSSRATTTSLQPLGNELARPCPESPLLFRLLVNTYI